MIADALGNPLAFTLTGAQAADITQAPALLEAIPPPSPPSPSWLLSASGWRDC
ncbi:hypothetical protein AB6713_04585 [Luteimonas sp. B3_2_R+30]|uniref:Uncharacterized protein n=1 Tax=Luteimonas salinilitoris TaxID=3237697 RepID=A0ABV4HME1_9GAMM